MPRGRQRTLQDIESFIRKKRLHGLRAKLLRDLQEVRIVKEADVECAAYHHLRRFIGEDPKWRVFARKHVRMIGRYVDPLIFKNNCPVIALELKWNRMNIEKKDRKALYAAITKLKVQKAYWLSVVYSGQQKKKLPKTVEEKYALFPIVVRLGLAGKKLDDFIEQREQYRSKMAVGRGRR
jgi:hypothetical protein